MHLVLSPFFWCSGLLYLLFWCRLASTPLSFLRILREFKPNNPACLCLCPSLAGHHHHHHQWHFSSAHSLLTPSVSPAPTCTAPRPFSFQLPPLCVGRAGVSLLAACRLVVAFRQLPTPATVPMTSPTVLDTPLRLLPTLPRAASRPAVETACFLRQWFHFFPPNPPAVVSSASCIDQRPPATLPATIMLARYPTCYHQHRTPGHDAATYLCSSLQLFLFPGLHLVDCWLWVFFGFHTLPCFLLRQSLPLVAASALSTKPAAASREANSE